jgi:hypothetical protein
MRLAELQAKVHALLRGEAGVAQAAQALGVPDARLGIYRDFVEGHVTRVLHKVHPYVAGCLGAATRIRLAASYYREVPATERELNAAAAGWAAFLDRHVADGDVPAWVPPLAQLEWALWSAWSCEAEVAPGPTRAVNPTLVALEVRWGLVRWLVTHPEAADVTPATPPPEALAAPELALVFRREATHRIAFHVATGDLLFAMKVVHEGVPLARAAELAGVTLEAAQRALDEAIAIGLVV